MGGKGLFVKELEVALEEGRADLAAPQHDFGQQDGQLGHAGPDPQRRPGGAHLRQQSSRQAFAQFPHLGRLLGPELLASPVEVDLAESLPIASCGDAPMQGGDAAPVGSRLLHAPVPRPASLRSSGHAKIPVLWPSLQKNDNP